MKTSTLATLIAIVSFTIVSCSCSPQRSTPSGITVGGPVPQRAIGGVPDPRFLDQDVPPAEFVDNGNVQQGGRLWKGQRPGDLVPVGEQGNPFKDWPPLAIAKLNSGLNPVWVPKVGGVRGAGRILVCREMLHDGKHRPDPAIPSEAMRRLGL